MAKDRPISPHVPSRGHVHFQIRTTGSDCWDRYDRPLSPAKNCTAKKMPHHMMRQRGLIHLSGCAMRPDHCVQQDVPHLRDVAHHSLRNCPLPFLRIGAELYRDSINFFVPRMVHNIILTSLVGARATGADGRPRPALQQPYVPWKLLCFELSFTAPTNWQCTVSVVIFISMCLCVSFLLNTSSGLFAVSYVP